MKNNLTDVNEYLFEQLDALSNPDLTTEELQTEIDRTKQITDVSRTIIANGRLMLDAQKHSDEWHRQPSKKLPGLLETTNED